MSLELIREKIFPKQKGNDFTDNFSAPENEEKIIFSEQFPTLKEAEDAVINEALKRAEGNQSIAADLLGITRRALNNRLNRKQQD
jgi:DNA-binding NtrC family response regulator